MSDVAAIDGITGPGRRTTLIQGDIQEITFRLKKKVIEIVNRDGSMGQYDLAQVSSVRVDSEGTSYTLAIVSRETKDIEEEKGMVIDDGRRENLIDGWNDTINERSTKIRGAVSNPDTADSRDKAFRSDKERREAHTTPGRS